MPGRVGSWAILSDSGLPFLGQEGKMFLGQGTGPGFKELWWQGLGYYNYCIKILSCLRRKSISFIEYPLCARHHINI